jgi:predicted CXXCH cytochrome family protein
MGEVIAPAAPRHSRVPRICTISIERGTKPVSFEARSLRTAVSIMAASAVVALTVAGGALLSSSALLRPARAQTEAAAPTFVGSETCAGCHRSQADLWGSSQHRRAMAHASDESVRADFNDTSFDHAGVHSRFFRRDGKFLVETDGPDGKLATFEVKYTFGVEPLQQYLIEFPDGRVQALSIAWDTRPKAEGGQRWFHLYPKEEIKHDDVLHWTRLNQNWNFMCAECHSTGVRKNYDAANDRFSTTMAEISVGCEACHGQGSDHVAWGRAQQSWWPFSRTDDPGKGLLARFDERQGVSWYHDPRSGEARRSVPPAMLRKEVEACGRCHARRSEMAEDWVPGRWLSETHVVSPLTEQVYWPDGQMRDVEEAYNYVPFKQSRMFAAGVTCGDCHEPHGGKLRVAGGDVCLQCHASETYAGAKHSHHEATARQPDCISCHMPARTYMVVDARHDHSLRIPRPDLSAKLGTPNACNGCHGDKPVAWAADAVARWFGPERKGFQTYAAAYAAAWSDRAEAGALLAAVAADAHAPDVARASALAALAPRVSPATLDLARRGLGDRDPVVRIGAMDMLANVPAEQVWALAAPLLSDPVRGVRMRAALLLAVPTARQPAADRERFERAAAEFVAARRLNADRPEDRAMLANFQARRGLAAEAEAEYQAALRLSPQFAPAAVNLADLYRQTGRDSTGEGVLRSAIATSPQDPGLHYALGLLLTRAKRPADALDELRRASELAPDRARYAYVYAVALHSGGQREQAMTTLKKIVADHPTDRDALQAIVAFARDGGDVATALDYAKKLAQMAPGDPAIKSLVESLQAGAAAPAAR